MSDETSADFVLDSSALLAFFQGEPGASMVEARLHVTAMSSVNLGEVLTIALRKRDIAPETLRPQIRALGIQICDFTEADSVAVAELWPITRGHGLSLGDRACLALGKRLNAKVLTAESQTDWRKLNIRGLRVSVIR